MREESEGNGIAHRTVSGRGGMKVVSAIEGGEEPVGMLGGAYDRVKVNYRIKMSCGKNPLIHALPVLFA